MSEVKAASTAPGAKAANSKGGGAKRRFSDSTASSTNVASTQGGDPDPFHDPQKEGRDEGSTASDKIRRTCKMDLEISGRPFHGRKRELELLSRMYQDHLASSDDDWPTERAVLIQGDSGTGKTTLVHQFVGQLKQEYGSCQILHGKYQEMTRQDPFSAIEHAFGSHFQAQTTSEEGKGNASRRCHVFKAIGGETGLEVLRGVIPALGRWLTMDLPAAEAEEADVSQSSEQSVVRASNLASTSKAHQLHYVFGRLVKALTKNSAASEKTRPLVLVLDNLQWADTASLDLLVYLVKQNIPHFFLIGVARSEEDREDNDDLFPPSFGRLADYSSTLPLQNHSYEEIADFISQELNSTPPECQALARAVFEKTKGNYLFALHLIEELRQQLQQPSPSWGEEDVLHYVEQSKAHSIGDAVSDRISHLANSQVKLALMVASYLGSQFTVSNLQSLFCHIKNSNMENEGCFESIAPLLPERDLFQLLEVAVLEGLLYNNVGSMSFQFTHDGIREAAYNMMPPGPNRDHMLFQVGTYLKEAARLQEGEDWMIFVAARHWSEIRQIGIVDRFELARLCLQCGLKSIGRAAYEEASRWLQKGLDSLESNSDEGLQLWNDHYDLTLQLYRSASEAELLIANYEYGYTLGNKVLDNAKNLLDKLPTYYAMDAALGLQDRHDEALKLNMEVLTELNEVPTTIMAIRDFFQVKRLIRETTDEEILSLPETTDPYRLAAARCLGNAGTRAYCSGKMLLMMAITLRQVNLTLQHGLNAESPMVFAGYGVALLSGMGHPHTGHRMGKLARRLATRQGFHEQECKTLYLVGSFIELWTVPFDKAIATFERAHELGLMSGNHDFGYGAELDAITTSFVAGRTLDTISHRFQRLKKEVDQYNLDALKRVLEPLGELLFHLGGQCPSGSEATQPTFIDWEALDIKEEIRPDSSNHYTLTWAYLDRMILAFFMDNMAFAEQMMKKFHDIAPGQSYTFCTLGSFFSALVCAKLARNSKYSKHKKLAQKHTKEMKKLVDKGCSKNSHKFDLLKAECMSLNRGQQPGSVQQAYDLAIASAKESGCQHDHALANELAGEYFVRQMQPNLANCYLTVACSLYMEWGAHNKVEQLLQKHGLNRDDVPAPTTSANDENFQPGLYPAINLGSTVGGSVPDDLSALTPIPENSALMVTNRWENGGATQKDTSKSPPKPPRRPGVSNDAPVPPKRLST